MLRLELDFLPTPKPSDVAVVIDILRMTTTAGVLFKQGLSDLFVVAGEQEARALAEREGALLVGERKGVKLPGFDGGNSPLEYLSQDLSGKRAVICTSNGSKAVEAAGQARHLLLGAIVNAEAVAKHALSLADTRVTLICSGTGGQVSLDDVLGAGCMVRDIRGLEPRTVLSDSCKLVLRLLEATPNLHAGLQEARHAGMLRELGFFDDIAFAARQNALDVVPWRRNKEPPRFTAS